MQPSISFPTYNSNPNPNPRMHPFSRPRLHSPSYLSRSSVSPSSRLGSYKNHMNNIYSNNNSTLPSFTNNNYNNGTSINPRTRAQVAIIANGFDPQNLTSMANGNDNASAYPVGFAQLLRHQQRNIRTFKLKISKQKQRIDEDMNSFKVQLTHTLEDLRLSLHANMDRIYQVYLEKVSRFKSEIYDIDRMRQQLEIEMNASSPIPNTTATNNNSNNNRTRNKNIPQHDTPNSNTSPFLSHLSPNLNINHSLQTQRQHKIANLQNNNLDLRKYNLLGYWTQMQKQRLRPLVDLQRELIVMNQYQNGFYRSGEFVKVLDGLREIVGVQVGRVYGAKGRYIREVEEILGKEREEEARGGRVLEGLDLGGVAGGNGMMTTYMSPQMLRQVAPQMPHSLPIPPLTHRAPYRSPSSPLHGSISPSQQSLALASVQHPTLTPEPYTFNPPTGFTSRPALCGLFINNQIALGLKDGPIQIFSCDGFNITTLNQHKSNICVLATVRGRNGQHLLSGSDVGDARVIVWDAVTWQAVKIFTGHHGAVTGLVDLYDQSHFVSAGYDRKIIVYDLQQKQQVSELPQTQSAITALAVNKNGSKVIACGLLKVLYVYQVIRDSRQKAQNLILERKIQNNATICSMTASQLLPQLLVIATKDNKIKLVNINKGQSYKSIPFVSQSLAQSDNPATFPVDMTIIQRQTNPYYPLAFVWPYKQSTLYHINTDNTLVSLKNMSISMLEYGYGVSPKCFYVQEYGKGVMVYVVSQRGGGNGAAGVWRIGEER